MKNKRYIYTVFLFTLMLSACSTKSDANNLYKTEQPLQADIIIPKSLSTNKKSTFKVKLTKDGKRVNNPDYVHFEIWKQDKSVKFPMEQAKKEENGAFSLTKNLNQDGLYYIQVHASKGGDPIMPKKQFVVGQLSKNEWGILKSGAQKEENGHHHHH
ncbi:FixH family protein [Priestia megaterium]|uniref:FixH family protein n=1 Tax=Priestia megaterium TaxID=1404 RepID=UPI002E1CE114|nr:FixH family protein [Priestia megaterium]